MKKIKPTLLKRQINSLLASKNRDTRVVEIHPPLQGLITYTIVLDGPLFNRDINDIAELLGDHNMLVSQPIAGQNIGLTLFAVPTE